MKAIAKQTVRDINLKDAIVLMRVDYNVPLEGGIITSDFRIKASLPTLRYLLDHGVSKIILISHLGRPNGREEQYSLRPIAEELAGLLPGVAVNFVDQVSGPEVEAAVEELPEGGILLLENLRFYPGEQANQQDFAQSIVDSTHASLFVQDGFAVLHRANASTDAITKLLPTVAGLLVEQEIDTLTQVLDAPEHPLVVVIGGAKVEDKMPMVAAFFDRADKILVGGKIAADGYTNANPKVYIATDFDEDESGNKLDIGPISMIEFIKNCETAKTIVWSGVLGKIEDAAYATSSTILAKFIGEHPEITSIICGGDTSGFVENLVKEDPNLHYSLISTGGTAALALITRQEMPGINNLNDK